MAWSRGVVGIVADRAGAGGPLAAWQGYPCPPLLGVTVCGPWRGCGGSVRCRFIFPGGGLGAHFSLPVPPAGEVLSSPQMPVQDNETKAGIFPGKVIIVDHGK